MSSFFFILFVVSLETRHWSPSARLRFLLLRVVAGLGVEASRIESCGTDVVDVLADELEGRVDRPRTTIGAKFSVLHRIFLPFLQDVVFDHWSTHRNLRDLHRAFQAIELLAYPRRFVLSRTNPNRRRTLLLPHVFALLHWL